MNYLIDGKCYNIKDLVAKTGISQRAIYYKMDAGVNTLNGLKSKYRQKYMVDGKLFTMRELINKTGLSQRSVYSRLHVGIRTIKGMKNKNYKPPNLTQQIINKNKSPNWKDSMFNDTHGHWKLLAKYI